MRKLWLEKFLAIPAAAMICLSHWVRRPWESGRPSWRQNKGPGELPLWERYAIMACTAQTGWRPRPIWMSESLQKGSILDALILTRIQEGEDGASTAISRTVNWIKGEKLAKLGTVNSAARRKPKYPKVHAAQNMNWSGVCISRDLQITNMRLSVIGKRLEEGEPCEHLIPRMTPRKRWQFCRGSGNA